MSKEWWLKKDCTGCVRYPNCDFIETRVAKPRGCSLYIAPDRPSVIKCPIHKTEMDNPIRGHYTCQECQEKVNPLAMVGFYDREKQKAIKRLMEDK